MIRIRRNGNASGVLVKAVVRKAGEGWGRLGKVNEANFCSGFRSIRWYFFCKFNAVDLHHKKEKQEKEQKKSKNPFVYEQLSEMCPNLRSKDYKLYESNSPYTQRLKNIPEGSKVGGGAYFDGNNYYGRSYLYAPDAEDGNFIVHSNKDLIIGEYVKVKINNVSAYDVEGDL
jgi:hypothetical protein